MGDFLIPIIGVERLRMATDGDGIRTLIGTYGCTLRCKYCLNPQSWNKAIKPALYTPEKLYAKVSIDSIYFQATNGGLTIGDGEPLLYMPAIEEFSKLCPETWKLWVETALNVDRQFVTMASNVFQHFIVDIKTMDATIYKNYTSRDQKRAFRFLRCFLPSRPMATCRVSCLFSVATLLAYFLLIAVGEPHLAEPCSSRRL